MFDMFKYDSPLMQFLSKVADLLWLNILFILCSIPIITIGASTTAMYYVSLKLIKDSEGNITSQFFRSFRQNFKQTTLIWSGMLGVIGLLVADIYIFVKADGEYQLIFKMILLIMGLLFIMIAFHVFPLLSKFENDTKNALKNAVVIALTNIPKTALMIVFALAPAIYIINHLKLVPLLFLLGFSLPAFVNSIWLNKIYKKIEESYGFVKAQEEN